MIKVMLVDDESIARNVMQRIIPWKEMGIKIIGCYSNAVEALSEMTDEMPDILITDIKMPEMNGIELIQRAKSMYPFLHCVILSGYEEFALAQAAMMEGVRYYLLKPCTKEKVENVIKECIAQIEKDKKNILHDSNCREIAVKKLLEELLEISGEQKTIEISDIKKIMASYEDIGLLREAAIALVLRCRSVHEANRAISSISRFYGNRDQICEEITDILHEYQLKVQNDISFVDIIKRYVDENYHVANLTLRYVSEEVVFMNTQYVGKQFYKQTGMKFSEYLLNVRMEHVKKLLTEREKMKVSEIAECVGLGENIKYFYQLFKKHTGKTLKEYRNN